MPSTMPKKNWYKPMTLVTRLTVTASSSNDWKPSFSSIVATGSRPPYGVRFLPRKSYGVEALILLGSGITSRTPCLAGFRRVCCFLWFTIWVAPENRSAKLELRAPTVLTQDSQGLQMDALPATSFKPQFRCIIQVLRLLIKDITVEKPANQKQLLVHVRWQGGACSDVTVQLPPNVADRVRYPFAVVDRIREMARNLPA